MPNNAKAGTALVLGVSGQDGAYLAQQLLADGWTVVGGHRRGAPTGIWRLKYLGIHDDVKLVDVDLSDAYSTITLLRSVQPDQIYHLAGESFVADSFNHPAQTIDANTIGTLNVLNAVTLEARKARVFFASSSEIFGEHTTDGLLDESSRKEPINPYGVSKLAAQNLVGIYRKRHSLFATSGVLFNHESPLRSRNYVTRKITFNMARLKVLGGQAMELGNLDSRRDWGFAPDYTMAMRQILRCDTPDDFVIASGQLTSVREFLRQVAITAAFDPVFEGTGHDEVCYDRASGQELAKVAERYFRPLDTTARAGSTRRLSDAVGWRPQAGIKSIAQSMVDADVRRIKAGVMDV